MPRFGLAWGSAAGLFYLLCCLNARLKFPEKKAFVVSALISTIPLLVCLTSKEQALLKLLIYPLAARAFGDAILSQKGCPKLSRHGDILGYFVVSSIIGLTFMVEKISNPMTSMIDNYTTLD